MGNNRASMQDHEELVRRSVEPLLAGESLSTEELSDRAAYSTFHFHRVFKRVMGETPAGMRRRLLLERAAWLISKEATSATETAFEVGFESLEGFGRAFKRSFGCLPSQFSESKLPLWLSTPNGVHYSPLLELPQGEKTMDLIDRLLDTERATLARLFDALDKLPDSKLDEQLPATVQEMCFEPVQRTLRDLIDNYLLTMEAWLAAVEDQGFPETRDATLPGMRARAEVAIPMFSGLVRRVRDAKEWDTEFEDALCETPQKFSFGGMIAHVITHNTFRRQWMLNVVRQWCGDQVGWGDPLDLEQAPV